MQFPSPVRRFLPPWVGNRFAQTAFVGDDDRSTQVCATPGVGLVYLEGSE